MALDYNYTGALEGVPVKVVTFWGMSSLVFTVNQWQEMGGYKGFIKEWHFPISDIEKVVDGTMSPVDFANMGEWDG